MKPKSSPLERLGRVIEDFHEYQQYAEDLRIMLFKINPNIELPAEPICRGLIEEEIRWKLTIPAVRRNRVAMRLSRMRTDSGHHLRGHQEFDPSLEQDILAEIALDPQLELEAGLTDETKAQLEKLLKE